MRRSRAEIVIVLHRKSGLCELHVHLWDGFEQGDFCDDPLAMRSQIEVLIFLSFWDSFFQHTLDIFSDDVAD